MDVAGEFNGGIAGMLFLQRFHIAGGLRMVPSGDYQFGIGRGGAHDLEGFNHELKPFVSSPLAESENAMLGIAAAGKIGIFGPARQNAVRPDVNIIVAILLVQDFAVAGH
jgi:hypothetical protein